ncbi:MAG: CHRD domain-containing protein [Acidobacteriota bacterium]
MKRFVVLVLVLGLGVMTAGCDEDLAPAGPTAGTVTFVSQMTAGQNIPPAHVLESAAAGQIQMTLSPSGAAYTASVTIRVQGLVRSGILPAPLDSGSVLVAGLIHQGGAGQLGPIVASLGLSQAAPLVTPTGGVFITLTGIQVQKAVGDGMIANPAGFYIAFYSALSQTGVMRGQLARQ